MATHKKVKVAEYDVVISKVFKDLLIKYGNKDFYPFTKADIENAAKELELQGKIQAIKNIADIKYTYDARRKFPSDILEKGFWGIVGVGKSKYHFEKMSQSNLILTDPDLKSFKPAIERVKDKTPPWVSAVIGNDEQATMTRIRYNDLISKFLGMHVHHVQGHERTTISCGQVEIDEVYVGRHRDKKFIIPISAKGGEKDCLSYTQALNLSLYAHEKEERFKDYTPVPLGVLRTENGDIYIVKFNKAKKLSEVKIEQVAVYKLV